MRLGWKLFAVAALAVVGAVAVAGPSVTKVEEPPYAVIRQDSPFEIRSYEPMVVAEFEATGSRRSAIGEGFRAIANYIFGGNDGRQKIAMTAPVLQQPRSPEQLDATAWTVRFVMPRGWSLESLPRPVNGAVALHPVPAKRFVVVRFSGFAGDASVQKELELLRRYAAEQKLATQGEPILAFYDPPWTLPVFRRNEIMLELAPP